jgi:hypothetical protein
MTEQYILNKSTLKTQILLQYTIEQLEGGRINTITSNNVLIKSVSDVTNSVSHSFYDSKKIPVVQQLFINLDPYYMSLSYAKANIQNKTFETTTDSYQYSTGSICIDKFFKDNSIDKQQDQQSNTNNWYGIYWIPGIMTVRTTVKAIFDIAREIPAFKPIYLGSAYYNTNTNAVDNITFGVSWNNGNDSDSDSESESGSNSDSENISHHRKNKNYSSDDDDDDDDEDGDYHTNMNKEMSNRYKEFLRNNSTQNYNDNANRGNGVDSRRNNNDLENIMNNTNSNNNNNNGLDQLQHFKSVVAYLITEYKKHQNNDLRKPIEYSVVVRLKNSLKIYRAGIVKEHKNVFTKPSFDIMVYDNRKTMKIDDVLELDIENQFPSIYKLNPQLYQSSNPLTQSSSLSIGSLRSNNYN